MPQAIAYVAQVAASYISAWFASSYAGYVYYAAYAVVYAAEVYALTRATESLAKKGADGSGRGLEVQVTDTGQEGFAIYGGVRVSGVNVIPPLSGGTDGRYLEQVLALAVHEVTDYGALTIDGGSYSNSDIGAVTGTSSDGAVTTGGYANHLWVRRYKGTASQTVDYILSQRYPSAFDSNFRGRGTAYVALTYDWGKGDIYGSVPQVAFLVSGKKCYDPRADSSPGSDPTNPLYASFTSNPALCWADYLMADYGGQVAGSAIDWDSVVDAADRCEENVTTPAGSKQRYTFNGRLVLADEPDWRNNARLFVDAMLGRMIRANGKWYIYAGGWDTPTYNINKVDWLSIDRIKTVQPRDGGRWNRCFTWYVDPNRNWQRMPCYTRTNSVYQSADGGEPIPLEIEQPACTDEHEAQRKAQIVLRQSRNQIAVAGRLGARFRKLLVGDVVAVTFEELGWVDKTMRVKTCNLNPDATIDVGLVEEQEADWADLDVGDYGAPSYEAPPATNPTTPGTPTLSLDPLHIAGTLLFKFGEPTVTPIGTRYQIIRSHVSTDASVGTPVWDGDALSGTIYAPTSTNYYYGRAYVGTYFSAYYPNTAGIVVGPTFVTLNNAAATSNSLTHREIYNPILYTPDRTGILDMDATIEGFSTFDRDSGTFFQLMAARTVYVDSSLGVPIIPGGVVGSASAEGAFQGSFGWFLPSSMGNRQIVTLTGQFTLFAGNQYTLGVYCQHAAGSQTFTEGTLKYHFNRV
jgi:hypothetical protein